MNNLGQLVASLPEKQLIHMVKNLCVTEIAELVTSSKSLKDKKAVLDKIREYEILQALPEEPKKEMISILDTAFAAMKEMSKMSRK